MELIKLIVSNLRRKVLVAIRGLLEDGWLGQHKKVCLRWLGSSLITASYLITVTSEHSSITAASEQYQPRKNQG